MKSKDVAILDFGSEKITALVGCRDVNNTISIKGFGESEYDGFLDGEFLDVDKLSYSILDAVKKTESDSNLLLKDFYVSVPTQFSICVCKNCYINFQKDKKITQDDINILVSKGNSFSQYGSHSVVNYSVVRFVIDDNLKVYDPIGRYATKISACISYILVDNRFLNVVDKIFDELELNLVEYISSPLAKSLYLFDEEQRDKYVLLIDCGYISTSIALIKGGGMLAMSSFSLGGGHITGDLSQCLKISFNEAEMLKRKIVLSIEPDINDVYELSVDNSIAHVPVNITNEIVKARIEVIAKGIIQSVEGWKYEFPDNTPIYLTGGGLTYLKGARDYLSKLLGRNVETISLPIYQYNKPHLTSTVSVLDYAINRNEQENSGIKNFFKDLISFFKTKNKI